MATVADLQQQVHEWAQRKGWQFTRDDIPEKLMLMVTEIAEAMEEYRKGVDPTYTYFADSDAAKPEGIGVEIADVVIRCLQFCGQLGINLGELIELKMAYNERRPYRHGGKLA